MNSIENYIREELSQLETGEIDEKLPKILADKWKRFMEWHCLDAENFFPQVNEKEELCFFDYESDSCITLPDLFTYWLENVEKEGSRN